LEETKTESTEEIFIKDIMDRLKGKKALLVDDVPINRTITASMLEITGIVTDEAGDGAQAVKMFHESAIHEYSIIYMDVQMPVMNGYEAAETIRSLEREDAKTVPIIALTANAFREDIDRAIASGMNAHLAKPMDLEKTLEVTFRFLGV
jgi:CheY-like chemotaxis protein